MSDQKHVTPPGVANIDALVKECQHDPKAFLARRIDAIDAEADRLQANAEEYADKALAKRAEAEAGKWALAECLHDRWNPHGEKPRGKMTPRDGIKLSRLAEMVGWSDVGTVSRYINCHTQRMTTPGIRWAEAWLKSLGVTREQTRDQVAISRLRKLTDEEKVARVDKHVRLAKQAVEAIEDPEVREQALEAATPEVHQALAPEPEPEQIAKALEKPEVAEAVEVAQAKALNERLTRQIAEAQGKTKEQVEADLEAVGVAAAKGRQEARQDGAYWHASGRLSSAELALRPVRRHCLDFASDAGELEFDDEEVAILVRRAERVRAGLQSNCEVLDMAIARLQGEATGDWEAVVQKWSEEANDGR